MGSTQRRERVLDLIGEREAQSRDLTLLAELSMQWTTIVDERESSLASSG
jgi:hypothetical protein